MGVQGSSMLGDLILWLRLTWKQFKCVHSYKTDRVGVITGLWFGKVCMKCDRRQKM